MRFLLLRLTLYWLMSAWLTIMMITISHDDKHNHDDGHSHDDKTECFQSVAKALIQCRSFQEVHKAARTMKAVVSGFLISMPRVTAPGGSTTDTVQCLFNKRTGLYMHLAKIICEKSEVCTCIWRRSFVRNLRQSHLSSQQTEHLEWNK